jgi:hypothetical protein
VQLALPGLFAADTPESAPLRAALATHEHALRALLERVRGSEWTDVERARLLREIRAAHPGEKIIAFTQFADTAQALYRQLRTDAGVAVLTGRGALVAGGRLTRREAIARFAPLASNATPPRAAERIDVLITTDLLSEGVNLHDASVVVHLDFPWTPARLEQRVGRSRRMGARHTRTTVYTLVPPASSETLLRVEERLRAKMRAAGELVSVGAGILPAIPDDGRTGDEAGVIGVSDAYDSTPEPSATRRRELVMRALERWRAAEEEGAPPEERGPVAAAVRAPCAGVLALVRDADDYQLVAALGDAALRDDPGIVLQVLRFADGERVPIDERELRGAIGRVSHWIARQSAMTAAGVVLPLHASARHRAMRRIATITSRAPSHRRPILAPLAARARRAVTAPYGIGAERALEALVTAEMADDAWLRAMEEFGTQHTAGTPAADSCELALVAILVLRPDPPPSVGWRCAYATAPDRPYTLNPLSR